MKLLLIRLWMLDSQPWIRYRKLPTKLNLSKARRYIKKLQLIAFVSDNAATIRDALVLNGIQVLNAAFEADVLIAQNPFCMVVSGDGDYYFHQNVDTYAKFIMKGPVVSILAFKRFHILRQLDLSSQQLLALGILSGNDYGDNLPSVGITTVYKWIKERSRHTTAQGLVTAFTTQYRVTPALFENALQVFSLLTETALTDDESTALQIRVANLSTQYETLAQVLDHTTQPLIPRTVNRTIMELEHLKLYMEKIRFSKQHGSGFMNTRVILLKGDQAFCNFNFRKEVIIKC
jgi:hypothetical protein